MTIANDTALVLFSGGQDSTVCLAWALGRFARVETVGFDYGQRHAIELSQRARIRDRMAALDADWKARLGEDHLVKLDALAAISDTALTRDTAIAIAESGLPTTFVPGRNLIFFCFAGAIAYRRGARHLVAGMCETDYSGYPDCRDDTVKAMQVALTLGLDKRLTAAHPADVDRQGGYLRDSPKSWAASPSLISSSRTAIAVTWATARSATTGAMAAAIARPASCGRKGFAKFMSRAEDDMTPFETRRNVEGLIFLVLFCLTIPAANWMIGHVGTVCTAQGPCVIPVAPGIMAPSGVLMIGAALVLRDLVQRRLGVEFGIGAIVAGAAISAGIAPPSLVLASAAAFLLSEFADFARLHAARPPPPGAGGRCLQRSRAGGRLHRLPLARLRLARIPARPDRRQGLDGADRHSAGRLSAPPR